MTIKYKSGKKIDGLSTDTKPSTAQTGSIFTETDIGGTSWHNGSFWGARGWKELARTTLGTAGDTIDVSSLPNKRYYMLLGSLLDTGGAIGGTNRYNSDTGTNYAYRRSGDGGADDVQASSNLLANGSTTSASPQFFVNYIANYSTKEKLNILHSMFQNTAGAGTAPNRSEVVGKWANTTDSISAINTINGGAGDFAIGSEIVILGYDPADTHTNNFWEELTFKDWTGTADTVTTDTFTAKKYLWVQVYVEGTSSLRAGAFQVNADTGANYALRRSYNGSADSTFTATAGILPEGGHSTTNYLANIFIINISNKEKLFIEHIVEFATAGAGTAPFRHEVVGKWANTSSQITSFSATNDDTGNITLAKIKVWGHN